MTNELRKTIGRNMRYANMNEQIDNQISEVEKRALTDINAQMQINALKQQREANLQQMRQPMTAQEYAEYDDNGIYIGNNIAKQPQNISPHNNGIGQTFTDGLNHAAQGVSLGWSDELNGVIGGIGRVAANGIMRATGQSVNDETFGDAWNKGYQEYRDYARQELDDGYNRNPGISGLAEVGGALASPIKPFRATDRVNSLGRVYHTTHDLAVAGPRAAVANGIIGGIGITDNSNPLDYTQNIAFSTAGNFIGNKVQNRLLGINDMYKKSRMVIDGLSNIGASSTNNFINKQRNRENEDY